MINAILRLALENRVLVVVAVIGLAIGGGLVCGVALGAKAAHAVDPSVSKRIVAWVTVLVGIFVAVRLFGGLLGI